MQLLQLSLRDTDPIVCDQEDVVLLGRPRLGGVEHCEIKTMKELLVWSAGRQGYIFLNMQECRLTSKNTLFNSLSAIDLPKHLMNPLVHRFM